MSRRAPPTPLGSSPASSEAGRAGRRARGRGSGRRARSAASTSWARTRSRSSWLAARPKVTTSISSSRRVALGDVAGDQRGDGPGLAGAGARLEQRGAGGQRAADVEGAHSDRHQLVPARVSSGSQTSARRSCAEPVRARRTSTSSRRSGAEQAVRRALAVDADVRRRRASSPGTGLVERGVVHSRSAWRRGRRRAGRASAWASAQACAVLQRQRQRLAQPAVVEVDQLAQPVDGAGGRAAPDQRAPRAGPVRRSPTAWAVQVSSGWPALSASRSTQAASRCLAP